MVALHETGPDRRGGAGRRPSAPRSTPGSMPLAQNPLGKIPTLERPDGPALYDSRVICRYLDASGRRPALPGAAAALGDPDARGDRRRHRRGGAADGLRGPAAAGGRAIRRLGRGAVGQGGPGARRSGGALDLASRRTARHAARSRSPARSAISTSATPPATGAPAAPASPPGRRASAPGRRCRRRSPPPDLNPDRFCFCTWVVHGCACVVHSPSPCNQNGIASHRHRRQGSRKTHESAAAL